MMQRALLFLGSLWLSALLPLQGRAQGTWTADAIRLAQAGRLEEAEYKVEAALDSDEARDALTWYVSAFIQKELFVQREGRFPDSQARVKAVDHAMRVTELDPNDDVSGRNEALLTFLADTHLEDARDAMPQSGPEEATAAEAHFARYVAIRLHLNPQWSPIPDEVLFRQQLAELAFARLPQAPMEDRPPWLDWGRACYAEAAALEHDGYRSTFNLAVHVYNHGVRVFQAAENDLDAIDAALNTAATFWSEAAEGLERAIALDPEKRSGYEALAVVSEALLNQDRIAWCKANLQQLGTD